ncbi:MAG: helix-turn-helix domain-containing protein [Chloroflexi bacterium]|nr:helix-turn-helix domain-containing protein [Chloroflexota bacterium]
MRETIVMTGRDQQRALIVTEFVAGALTISEAATVLGLSERQVWRLRTRFLTEGPAAVVGAPRGARVDRARSDHRAAHPAHGRPSQSSPQAGSASPSTSHHEPSSGARKAPMNAVRRRSASIASRV